MPARLLLRPVTDDETAELRRLAYGQQVEARLRERSCICWHSHDDTGRNTDYLKVSFVCRDSPASQGKRVAVLTLSSRVLSTLPSPFSFQRRANPRSKFVTPPPISG